jgi:response regulator RpfG family c-di-GMP phosphodiesterase
MPDNLVLLVDDEPKVLSSLTRELLELDVCEVLTARSGAEGLEVLKKTAAITVVVSDYHMPGMDGIRFLCEAQKMSPDTTRIMLTGAAGLDMAIQAINLGQIFRFLLKPCAAEVLIMAVKAGIRQYQLLLAERELLQKTLNGSIKVMMDMLSALNPETFSQATRLSSLARQLAAALQLENTWEVELAAQLCRIGSVTVPLDVLEKWRHGYPLNPRETVMIQAIAQVGQQLVQNIPRLENVARGIGCHSLSYINQAKIQDAPAGDQIPILGRLLKLVFDYDRFLELNQSPQLAQEALAKHKNEYDPWLLTVFINRVLGAQGLPEKKPIQVLSGEHKVNIEDLQPGMQIVQDVVDGRGRLVVSKGTVITAILKWRLANYFQSHTPSEQVVIGEARFI